MDGSDWALIVVALVTLAGAIFSARAVSKAAELNANASVTSDKIQAETEAYQRARKMDVDTIEHQDREIDELRKENANLEARIRTLQTDLNKLRQEHGEQQEQIQTLRRHVARLEQKDSA
jgi:peptidoglycan hydrolase CwlO-like protein